MRGNMQNILDMNILCYATYFSPRNEGCDFLFL